MNNNITYYDELSSEHKKESLNILRQNAKEKAGLLSKNNGAFAFSKKDNNNNFQAAIEGYCYYGCCYIDLLAVKESCRGEGYGSQLMQQAEALARERECLFMAVNTMDFEAKPFYKKHGFEVEFIREGFEKGTKMYFLRKNL